nr:nuclear transport factor 2 family protein [Plantibacter sp. VKM Ac-2880]
MVLCPGVHSPHAFIAIDTVLALMRAFHEQDRAAAEALIHADFVFTSPQDDHLDRVAWFERCFPSADHFDAPSVTLQVVETDGIVFHRYEYAVDGTTFRNVETTRVVDGAVREVEVYFGGAV